MTQKIIISTENSDSKILRKHTNKLLLITWKNISLQWIIRNDNWILENKTMTSKTISFSVAKCTGMFYSKKEIASTSNKYMYIFVNRNAIIWILLGVRKYRISASDSQYSIQKLFYHFRFYLNTEHGTISCFTFIKL